MAQKNLFLVFGFGAGLVSRASSSTPACIGKRKKELPALWCKKDSEIMLKGEKAAGRFFGPGSCSVLPLRSPVTHPAPSPQVEASSRQAPQDPWKFLQD
jgi:hypothetical protein